MILGLVQKIHIRTPRIVLCLLTLSACDLNKISCGSDTLPTLPSIVYRAPDDPEPKELFSKAKAVVIPAVGPNLVPELFENSAVKPIQVTGAGVDRLDETVMKKIGIAVANVAGGSNYAVAEYAVSVALTLMRRFTW